MRNITLYSLIYKETIITIIKKQAFLFRLKLFSFREKENHYLNKHTIENITINRD